MPDRSGDLHTANDGTTAITGNGSCTKFAVNRYKEAVVQFKCASISGSGAYILLYFQISADGTNFDDHPCSRVPVRLDTADQTAVIVVPFCLGKQAKIRHEVGGTDPEIKVEADVYLKN